MPRTSIGGLMGAVLVASLALTALRSGSPAWAGATFLVTCGVLALAVVGAVCRAGAARAWWLGFALFGGGYLALAFWSWGGATWWNLPTSTLLGLVSPRKGAMGGGMGGFCGTGANALEAVGQTGHCLFGLASAALGGLLAVGLHATAGARAHEPVTGSRPEEPSPRGSWRRPAILGAAALIAASGVALIGLGLAPGYSAAVAFFATWALLGLAVVAAILGPRGRRAAWLGAALFGIGYMVLMFRHADRPNWPQVATDRLVEVIRDRFPWIIQEVPDSGDVAESNARIMKVLDRPIPMHYPNETPLEDVIRDIHAATQGPDEPRIAIYVDPLGFQEVERTMQSPIAIDLDGVPLRTSLSLILRQLGLMYQVGGGLLTITSGRVRRRGRSGARPTETPSSSSATACWRWPRPDWGACSRRWSAVGPAGAGRVRHRTYEATRPYEEVTRRLPPALRRACPDCRKP